MFIYLSLYTLCTATRPHGHFRQVSTSSVSIREKREKVKEELKAFKWRVKNR